MASLHYQQANVDLIIQEYLTTYQVQSDTQSMGFIMATNIGLSIFALEYIKQISYWVCAEPMHLDILVPSEPLSKTHALA